MPQIEVNEEQVLRALDQLSPTARRTALAKLIRGDDALDRLVERNRGRIEALCRECGLDFARLTEDERERLIDDLLHQAA
jgi:predicted ATPase